MVYITIDFFYLYFFNFNGNNFTLNYLLEKCLLNQNSKNIILYITENILYFQLMLYIEIIHKEFI